MVNSVLCLLHIRYTKLALNATCNGNYTFYRISYFSWYFKWVTTCVVYPRRGSGLNLTLHSECVWWLCSFVGAYQHRLGLLVLEGKVTESQNKLILCDETFLLWLEWLLPEWQSPHPQGMGAHWMVWRVWQWCESHALAIVIINLLTENITHIWFYFCFHREHINYAKSNSI